MGVGKLNSFLKYLINRKNKIIGVGELNPY